MVVSGIASGTGFVLSRTKPSIVRYEYALMGGIASTLVLASVAVATSKSINVEAPRLLDPVPLPVEGTVSPVAKPWRRGEALAYTGMALVYVIFLVLLAYGLYLRRKRIASSSEYNELSYSEMSGTQVYRFLYQYWDSVLQPAYHKVKPDPSDTTSHLHLPNALLMIEKEIKAQAQALGYDKALGENLAEAATAFLWHLIESENNWEERYMHFYWIKMKALVRKYGKVKKAEKFQARRDEIARNPDDDDDDAQDRIAGMF